jgi:uncharacterized delta-60 repeat protein
MGGEKMKKWILYLIVVSIMISVITGCSGGSSGSSFGGIGGIGTGGGSGYSPAIGVLDTSFNGTGFVVHDNAAGGNSHDYGNSIYVDSNGKIYVTGYSWNGSNDDMVIWRYNSNGTLDTTFNGTGFVVHDNAAGGNDSDSGYSIYVDSNGNIYVTGHSFNSSGNYYYNYDMVIWRYNSNGTLDTTFNGTGFVVHNNAAGGNDYDRGNSIYVGSNGKIYVTGYSWNGSNDDMVIWRYNSNGTLDTTFNGTGFVVHNNAAGGNSSDGGNSIYVGSNGKMYVTGFSINSNGNYDMVIWKYNSNGTLDTTFNGTGFVVHNNAAGGNGSDVGNSIYVGSNGKIYVTGYSWNGSNDDMVIWRYNSNGILDTTFNGTGFVVHNNAAGGNGSDVGNSIYVDSNGKIYVTGYSWNGSNDDMVIWRYNSNGILDTTFNGTGFVVHNNAAGGNSYDAGYSMYVDSTGKIYVTGFSENSSGNHDMVIWKYK